MSRFARLFVLVQGFTKQALYGDLNCCLRLATAGEQMNVLDLPLEKQKELALQMGESHSVWVEGVKRRQMENAAFMKKVHDAEANGGKLTDEERKRFQAKMDSGNPS